MLGSQFPRSHTVSVIRLMGETEVENTGSKRLRARKRLATGLIIRLLLCSTETVEAKANICETGWLYLVCTARGRSVHNQTAQA